MDQILFAGGDNLVAGGEGLVREAGVHAGAHSKSKVLFIVFGRVRGGQKERFFLGLSKLYFGFGVRTFFAIGLVLRHAVIADAVVLDIEHK